MHFFKIPSPLAVGDFFYYNFVIYYLQSARSGLQTAMSKPKKEIKSRNYLVKVNNFFAVVKNYGNDLNRIEDFFSDLLTESELRMLKRRWFVANLINEGKTIREAAEAAGVGTDTVVRVIKKIKGGSGVLRETLRSVFEKPIKQKKVKWFFGVN